MGPTVALPEGRVGVPVVVGAMSLYLEFINPFSVLLRLTESRPD